MGKTAVKTHNAEAVAWAAIPSLEIEALYSHITNRVKAGQRLLALTGMRQGEGGVDTLVVLADDQSGTLKLLRSTLCNGYPSLTPRCPQAHYFERELYEQWGIHPEGHPWLKPVRFPPGDGRPPVGCPDFFEVRGEEVHEVGVGPVHAGIIEPGHFRFSCHGERILHLEISLGYQHRGLEKALPGGPDKRTQPYMETATGDSSVAHTLAYCQLIEALSGLRCSPDSERLRAVALELERLANHVGDLGAMSGDVGFLPTASFCGGLRGDLLNLTAMLCGNRLGRGLLRPGGLYYTPGLALLTDLRARLRTIHKATRSAVDLLWRSSSVRMRFDEVGILDPADAQALGMVGPVARASGIARDVRHDHALGAYRDLSFEIPVGTEGSVFSRAMQRWLEIEQSAQFIDAWLDDPGMTECLVLEGPARLAPGQLLVSLVEGWRGEVCHIALTGDDGHFVRYRIIDPSFHNWYGLAVAMRGQAILDFPICNKSFNLSYCGHDL